MAFGYIRVRNISSSAVSSTEKHNERKYSPGKEPKNIRPLATRFNSSSYHGDEKKPIPVNLKEAINQRIDAHSIKLKSSQNCAIEFVIGASKDFWEKYDPRGHFSNAHEWLEKKYGEGSVVSKSEHFDESNPHCHFIVVPILQKEIKWKNRNGEGSRSESRMAIREATGGREKLRALQDDYFKFIKPYGDAVEVEFKRGEKKAAGTLEKYVKNTNYEIGEISEKIKALRSDLSSSKEKVAQLINLENRVQQIEDNKSNLQVDASIEDKTKKSNFDRGVGSELDRTSRKDQIDEDDQDEPAEKKNRGIRR